MELGKQIVCVCSTTTTRTRTTQVSGYKGRARGVDVSNGRAIN